MRVRVSNKPPLQHEKYGKNQHSLESTYPMAMLESKTRNLRKGPRAKFNAKNTQLASSLAQGVSS